MFYSSTPADKPVVSGRAEDVRDSRPRDRQKLNGTLFSETRTLLKDTALSYADDDALSRGAAIAFYTVTSIAPVLLVVIAVAGLAAQTPS
jgi:hypothetical protein